MDFYRLAKAFFNIRSQRVKLLAVAAADVVGMRSVGVFLDPVLACNLRCRMCYFSDEGGRPTATLPLSQEQVELLKGNVFRRAVKLQIGCGAEPTLYRGLAKLVGDAHQAGVPYIEITTNGQLLDYDKLAELADAGLGGITLSLHGTTAKTYEYLMTNASFEALERLIGGLRRLKSERPQMKLRVNYTFNNLNVAELAGIWGLFEGVAIDVLQIRPIQKIGESSYSDFDLTDIYEHYEELIAPIERQCKERGTLYMGPSREELTQVNKDQHPVDAMIEQLTYCYVSPTTCYGEGFELGTDTIGGYNRRSGRLLKALSLVFSTKRNNSTVGENTTKKLNYTIK